MKGGYGTNVCSDYVMLKNFEITQELAREVIQNVTKDTNFFKNIYSMFCNIFLVSFSLQFGNEFI